MTGKQDCRRMKGIWSEGFPFICKHPWEIEDSGKKDYHWDLYWCELNADINSAEVDQVISSEQAWYLRKKYLRMEQGE